MGVINILESDEKFMKLALSLAEKGRGYVNPNPLVGAVIVKDGKVIGEGYHTAFGKPHAEIEAINSATEDIKGATMYVTLEPCVMCAGALTWSQISKVVIGARDEKRGFINKNLQLHPKTELIIGVLENECSALVKEFFKEKR